MYAFAEAFAPDSTAAPVLCRLPFTCEGELVDSTWQEWMQHDPLTWLDDYRDSLLRLNDIQIFIGDQDEMCGPTNETFHQALSDKGVDHGYVTYSGGHDPRPVLEDMLKYFSGSLFNAVPTVRLLSETYYADGKDTLVFVSDMNGILSFVPDTVPPNLDSITQYSSRTEDIVAGEEKAVSLSDFEIGNYLVYAITGENIVCNIPERFSVIEHVPDVIVQVRDNHTNQHVSSCHVYLNGKSFWKDTEEGLQVTGWAYDTCSIRITSNFYTNLDTTVVVRSDTTLVFNIQYALPEALLELQGDPILEKTDYLKVMMSQVGTVYITPEDTPEIADSITKYEIISSSAGADRPALFPMRDIPLGTYVIYGLTANGRMATGSFVIQVIDHFLDISIDVKDAFSDELLESCLLVVNGQDTIQGLQGNFDLTGYYNTCSIAISREGYHDLDTTLILLSDMTYTIYLTSVTSLKEQVIPQIKVCPNPTTRFLTIELSTSSQSYIKITDINGQLLFSREIAGTTHQLDLSTLRKGVYFITIRSKDFVTTRKFIKF